MTNIHRQAEILKKTTKILAGKNIPVYTEGFAPRVEYSAATKEPVAVFIPEIPIDASDKLIAAVHGYIDHECGHILESKAEDICDTSKSKLWHYIHNCIEDPRINAKMSDRYHGSESNIRSGYNFLFEREDPISGKKAYSQEAIDEIDMTNEELVKDQQVNYSSLWFAKKSNCRFSSEIYDSIGADKLFDGLESKMSKKYLDALGRIRTPEEVAEVSDYFVDFFHKEFDEDSSSGEGEEKGTSGKAKAGEGRLDKVKTTEDLLAETIHFEIEHLAKQSRENWYFSDRFDEHFDKKAMSDKVDDAAIAPFELETKSIVNYLSKDLKRFLESRNRCWYTGGYKSGKLNQKVLHSVRVGNDRIFSRKSEIKSVKASVSLLIDLSGSMKTGGPTAMRKIGSGSKVSIAIKSAYAFAMVLENLKVPYEVVGFSTFHQLGKKNEAWEKFSSTIDPKLLSTVINPEMHDLFFHFKKFEDNFDIYSKKALIKAANGNLTMLDNEDSTHVRKALLRLAARPEEKKTLFVFSDGCPAFHGNTKTSMEMLKHINKTSFSSYGVDIFSIGILSSDVDEYYSNTKTVSDLDELPAALFGFLKTRI